MPRPTTENSIWALQGHLSVLVIGAQNATTKNRQRVGFWEGTASPFFLQLGIWVSAE